MISIGIENDGLMWRKLLLVSTNWFPLVKIARFRSLNSFRVTAVTFILMVSLHFLLIDPNDIKVKLSYLSASIFKPENFSEVIYVKTILISITFE